MGLDSDQPKITNDNDADKLGFYGVAESVANSIVAGDYPDGFVLGIEGDWGSGKTTFINFIRKHIKEKYSDFKIIEFKPWLHSSHENLIAAYFKLLSEETTDIFDNESEINNDFANIIDIFTPAAGAIVNLATAGIFGNSVEKVMDLASDKLKETPPLESQYLKIQDKLKIIDPEKKPKQHFLVIIDDLDRLDAAEIRTMLKLVKSVGKLPYVTYILAYDREYIEKATKKDMPDRKIPFLEKIVQLPIPIPKPMHSKLLEMLKGELEDFSETINFNNYNWQEIIRVALNPYIKKPRDIILLTNSVKFRFPAMKGIVDLGEFFILECLRVLDINLWNWIKNNDDIIFNRTRYGINDEDKKQIKEELIASLSESHKLSKSQARILSRLFPSLSPYLEMYSSGIAESLDEIQHREKKSIDSISNEFVYDAYFAQYLGNSEFSQGTINDFLENTTNREETTKTLRDLIDKNEPSRINKFIRMTSYQFENEQSPKPDKMLLWSLSDIFGEISSLSFSGIRLGQQIVDIFIDLFKRFGKKDTYAFLHDLCKDTKHVELAILLLHWVAYHIGEGYSDANPSEKIDLIDKDDWESIKQIIAPHLKNVFETGKIGDFASVVPAAFVSAIIFGEANAKAMFNKAYPQSEKYVIKSTKACLDSFTPTGRNDKYEYAGNRDSELFDHNLLAEYADKIDLEKQDEDTREAIKVFLEGVAKQNKADKEFPPE